MVNSSGCLIYATAVFRRSGVVAAGSLSMLGPAHPRRAVAVAIQALRGHRTVKVRTAARNRDGEMMGNMVDNGMSETDVPDLSS